MMEFVRIKLGFSSKLMVNSDGHSGDLCLLWTDGVVVDLLSFSDNNYVKVASNSLKN